MIRTIALFSLMLPAAGLLSAANITVMYGDNDGFGVGATAFTDPNASNGDSFAGTDALLIGTGGFDGPAFMPTAIVPFSISGAITSVTLTMSMASFGGNTDAVDGPNSVVINGLAVDSAFLDSFASLTSFPNIETKSFLLPSTFFALLTSGSLDLTGTHISERSGFGSFQVDYLQLDITTDDVSEAPEPSTMAMAAAALAAMGVARKRLS